MAKDAAGREQDAGNARAALQLLRRAHSVLSERAARLPVDDLNRRSFCREWTVAQVYSHLGSGAEIGALGLQAAREGAAPPDPWQVWNRWDGKAPSDMVVDFAPADAAYLDALEEAVAALEGGEVLLVPIDGRPWPLALAMTARLVELVLHGWDVAVVDHPEAEVDSAAAAWVLATFPLTIAALAVAPAVAARLAPLTVGVEIVDPADRLRFDILPADVRLERTKVWAPEPDAVLVLPDAAAWMRLVTGRWRPVVDDARAQLSGELALEDLYEMFPGF